MKRKKLSSPHHASTAAASPVVPPDRGFRSDLREIILPANRWHYAFQAVVILVALSYWFASLIFQPEASWAEMVMYRPSGDNQVWPVVTALSRFNLGDPTDSLHYGEGVAGFHAVILLPYAIAFAIFGPAGYMITDAVLCWCFFVALAMLLRRWGMGPLGSTLLSCALTTTSLQLILQKISEVPARILTLCEIQLAEWDFPNIFNLTIFGDRVPRPVPTEIFVVLVLYFLTRLWLQPRFLTMKQGLAVGALMGLLAQGDPYSFAALGLVILATIVRAIIVSDRRIPWRFCLAGMAGAILTGWYLIVQLIFQHPDSAARFGLAKYARDQILMLPGYGPWLRVLIIIAAVVAIRWLVRRYRKMGIPQIRSASVSDASEEKTPLPSTELAPASTLALLAAVMVTAAWLAQPVQLFLLGKGAQIFHYFFYTLPLFFSYAVVLLAIQLFKVLRTGDWLSTHQAPAPFPRRAAAALSVAALVIITSLGLENSLDTMMFPGLSRRETSPFEVIGNNFRPGLRGLDKAFRENPALKDTRSFAALCQEVNFLLTAFHDKRAYLPDNAFTTLSDEELETRLCEVGKLSRMKPEEFAAMIQHQYVMNYWLGCAKYWCASDYKFAPESDYQPERLELVRKMPKQSAFNLVLPISEFNRIMEKYVATLNRPSDTANYPDAFIISAVVKEQRIVVDPELYRETYSNAVFSVYTKVPPP